MKTHYIIAAVAGIAAGYLAAQQLVKYQPWTTAYTKAGGF